MAGLLVLFVTALFGAPQADAQDRVPTRVILMFGADQEGLATALSLEVADRPMDVRLSAPPAGATALGRAASAQETARIGQADAAIYLEPHSNLIRIVGRERDAPRSAPLASPLEQTERRVIALVAKSLIDELFGLGAPVDPAAATDQRPTLPSEARADDRVIPPAEWDLAEQTTSNVGVEPTDVSAPGARPPESELRVNVDVRAEVQVTTTATERAPPVAAATGPSAQPSLIGIRASEASAPILSPSIDNPDDIVWSGFYLAGSALFAGVAAGLEVELGYHLTEQDRLALTAAGVGVFVPGLFAGNVGARYTHIGRGPYGRFDFGLQTAAVLSEEDSQTCDTSTVTFALGGDGGDRSCADHAEIDVGFLAGAFAGFAWEYETFAVGFRAALNVVVINDTVLPAPFVTGFVELPL